MQLGQESVRFLSMHRRLDYAWRDSVDPDSLARIFNRERLCCRVQSTLRQRRQRRRHAAICVINEAGRDLYDVPGAPLQHLLGCEAGDVKKATEIDTKHVGIIFVGIVSERLCDEDTGIVDERVDAAEAL